MSRKVFKDGTGKVIGKTTNLAETVVTDRLQAEGYEILKRGWPDFIAIAPDGTVRFIEVKPSKDRDLSPEQQQVAEILSRFGIMVEKIAPDSPNPVVAPSTHPTTQALQDWCRADKILGVIGDRKWVFTDVVEDVLMHIPEPVRVYTGTRPGVQRQAYNICVRRRLNVEEVKSRGRITSQKDYDISTVGEILKRVEQVLIFTTGADEGSNYALAYCSRNRIPFRVVGNGGVLYEVEETDPSRDYRALAKVIWS